MAIPKFRDKVRFAASKQTIRLLLIVGIVTNGAGSCIVNNLSQLTEVVVGVCSGGSTIGIRCTQQKSASLFVAMSLDYASCIRGILNRQ